MAKTLSAEFIRCINFFEDITKIRPEHCFAYNNALFFTVPERSFNTVRGRINLLKLSIKFRRRVRILSSPGNEAGVGKIESFIRAIVSPIQFKKISLNGEELTINTNIQSKAMLMGRDKKRMHELQNILEEYFNIKSLKIV